MLSPQAALVYAMVVAAGSDGEIAQEGIDLIGDLVDYLPIFRGIDRRQVTELAIACSEQLSEPGGTDQVYAQIRKALSGPLRGAAYALSCDVIRVDCRLQRDRQALERIRQQLEVDPATARTIERAAGVRSQAA
jgi:uncharacterized membrane protein YebE (DUF533 family)